MARKFVVSSRLTTEDDSSGVVERNNSAWVAWSKTVAAAGIAAAATVKFFTELRDSVFGAAQAASVDEKAVVRLESALVRLGAGAQDAAARLREQAEALEAQTGIGADVITNSQALIAAFGATEEQTSAATQAALDLSAALGISLEQASRTIGRTLGGFAGELTELVPAVRDLTREQLLAGDAIQAVADAYGGTAVRALDTYADRLERVARQQENVTKALGETTVESEKVAEALDTQAAAYSALADQAGRFGFVVERLVTGFTNLKSLAIAAGAAVLRTAGNLLGLAEAGEKAASTGEQVQKAIKGVADEMRGQAKAAQDATKAAQELARIYDELLDEAGVRTQEQLTAALDRQQVILERLNEEYRIGAITRVQFEQAQAKTRFEIAALEAVLSGQVATVDDYKRQIQEATNAQSDWTDVIDLSTDRIDLNTRALRENQNAQDRLNQSKRDDPDRDPLIQDRNTIGGGTFTVVRPRDQGPRIGSPLGGWVVPTRNELFSG